VERSVPLMSLFGNYVADTRLGRFQTIIYAVVMAEIGDILLTVSATLRLIAQPSNALGLFVVGPIIVDIGTGAFKPNISPLTAEQISQEAMHVDTNKKGERVIVDPSVTATRIYSYFYLCINIGALLGQLGMVYAERYDGFYLSFLIPTIAFLTCFPVLFFCKKYFTLRKLEGSVHGPAVKLFLLALNGRFHLNPVAT
jgi:POT family proton-dependent oligopeptide transporter